MHNLNRTNQEITATNIIEDREDLLHRRSPNFSPAKTPTLRHNNRLPSSSVTKEVAVKPSKEAFWLAWNNHRDYLKRLSMVWMNVSASDAEDAFSDATIHAYEKYGDHAAQISNERAWFARLLHNICIDRHRANKRRFTLNEKVREVTVLDSPMSEGAELSPEKQLLNAELGAFLCKAIMELPERLRIPLILRLVQGEDYQDIADALEISNDNARKRVQQARSALRHKLTHLKD